MTQVASSVIPLLLFLFQVVLNTMQWMIFLKEINTVPSKDKKMIDSYESIDSHQQERVKETVSLLLVKVLFCLQVHA